MFDAALSPVIFPSCMRTKQNLLSVWFLIGNIGPAIAGLLGPSHTTLGPFGGVFGGAVGGLPVGPTFIIKNHANSIMDAVISAPPASNLSTNTKAGLGHGNNNLSESLVLRSVQGHPNTLPRHVAGVEKSDSSVFTYLRYGHEIPPLRLAS